MSVEIKYIVVREGIEKMAFANKKEADAYDRMLDLAEVLNDWLSGSDVMMEENQREELSLWLAEKRDMLTSILKNGKLPDSDGRKKEAEAGTVESHSLDQITAANADAA